MWTPDLTGRNPVKYVAIVEALAEAVAGGVLRPGDRLPPQRDLAWALGVNLSTVSQAYREAARRHLVSGEVGRGTYVLADSREAALFALKEVEPEAVIDLSTNIPAIDPENRDLETTLAALLTREGGLGPAQGYHAPALLRRAQIAGARWLSWRGLELKPASVIPCAGAQEALVAALLALCRPGDAVLVEEVTFPGLKAVAKQLDLRLVGVPLDAEGVLPDALDRACRATGARIAVLVPILQNPTGAVMGEGRRADIAAVVRRHGLVVVEDDVYGALTERPPLTATIPEHGIVVSSLSKAVAPGLRFGFVAGAAPGISSLAGEMHATVWPTAPLMMEVACAWIEDGTAIRRARWQRAEVAARDRLADRIPGRPPRGADPSPHLWLPVEGSPDEAAARCRSAGVEVVPGAVFAVGRDRPPFLRASLTTPATRRDLGRALERLSRAFASPLRDAGPSGSAI